MVFYQSKGGSTEKVAKAIAKAANMGIHNLKHPYNFEKLLEGEIVFVGGALYAGNLDKTVTESLKELATLDKNIKVALFGTCSSPGKVSAVLRQEAEAAKLSTHNEIYECRGKFLLMARSHPDAGDLFKAAEFAKKVVKELSE